MIARVGMWIFLGSTTVLFGALTFAYAMLRARAGAWPPPGSPPLPFAGALVSCAVLALSSALLAAGERRLDRGAPAAAPLLAAVAAGWLFLVLQWRVWGALLSVDADALLASVMLLLAGVHAVHVLAGLFALAAVVPAALRGARSGLALVALFWHYVDVAWLVLFVCLFVI